MPDVVIGEPKVMHLHCLGERMRAADVDEVLAAGGSTPLQVVVDSVALSTMCWSAEIDGELACIFGCAPIGGLLATSAAPWMLGTDLLDKHPRALMRNCRGYVEQMLNAYPLLINYVDARNERSVRWLRRLGFVLFPPEPYGPRGLPFHRFEMETPYV